MRLKNLVVRAADLGELWVGISGVEVTPHGRLFLVWYSGGPKEPHEENRVYLRMSDDGARTFTEPKLMAVPTGGLRAFAPGLWMDPDGVLWLLYNRSSKETGDFGVYCRTCTNPDAVTPEWSIERRIGFDVAWSHRVTKPVVLTSGEWLMPVTWAREWSGEWHNKTGTLQGVAISKDHGRSWALHGAVEAPPWALQDTIVERKDGVLQMYIRTGAGVLWQSTSHDRGRTWAEGSPTTIPNPGSRYFVRRLQSGRWLLINSPDPSARVRIEAYLSEDEGVSWSRGLVLDERENVAYPDAIQRADGTIYCIYDRDRRGAGEILLAEFREEDIPRS